MNKLLEDALTVETTLKKRIKELTGQAFVSILDDMGFVVALAGPFDNEDAAQDWADKMEAEDNHGDIQEPYTVLIPTNPTEFE